MPIFDDKLKEQRDKADTVAKEANQKKFITDLTKAIISAINKISIDSVEVTNLDVIQAALRNELSRVTKPLINSIGDIRIPSKVKIDNFPQQKDFPTDIKINNITDIKPWIDALGKIIQNKLNIPKPIINIPEIKVDVPEPQVNLTVPEVDFSPILKELKSLANKLSKKDTATPAKLDGLSSLMSKFVQFQSDTLKLVDKKGKKVNPPTQEGTDLQKGNLSHEQLSVTSTATIFTNAGSGQIAIQNIGSKIIYIGGSTVSDSSRAFQLVPRQFFTFDKVANNFNFYHATASGETSTLGVSKYV